MTQYDKIKNICYYTFVSGYIIFVFFYLFNRPVIGDYWNLEWVVEPIYNFSPSNSTHPGRNFGEFLSTFPKTFASWLSFIPEPLYRVKFLASLLDTVLLVSLACVSSYIIGKKQKLSFLIFLFYIFYSHHYLTWSIINTMAALPMLYVAMLPAIFYLRDHTLPQWMKDNPYKTFGYWAVFCYMGSQVYDPVYFMGTAFCGMILLYLIGLYCIPNLFEQKIKDKTSFYLTGSISVFYILLSFMAAFKNASMSKRLGAYESTITFNISEILKRIQTQYTFALISILIASIIVTIGIIAHFIKNKKISGSGYVYVALTTSSAFAFVLITIIGSYHTSYVLWSSLIVVVATVCYLWTNIKWTQIFIPTIVFAVFIKALLLLNYTGFTQGFLNNTDIELMYLLKDADSKNLTQVSLSTEEARYFRMNESVKTQIPATAKTLGYTKELIPIVVTNKE